MAASKIIRPQIDSGDIPSIMPCSSFTDSGSLAIAINWLKPNLHISRLYVKLILNNFLVQSTVDTLYALRNAWEIYRLAQQQHSRPYLAASSTVTTISKSIWSASLVFEWLRKKLSNTASGVFVIAGLGTTSARSVLLSKAVDGS